jgi:uncharacterized protein YcbX
MNRIGTVAALTRYPVKSLEGEALQRADVDARGLVGDRTWCVRTEDGFIGSGKSTRRFRRVGGLLALAATGRPAGPPAVRFPDGALHVAGTPAADAALAAHTGRPVTFSAESHVSNFDDGPVHLVTTSSLRRLADVLGDEADPRRFRANLVLDTPGLDGLPEHGWLGRRVAVGEVLLEVVAAMPRCVMVTMATADLDDDHRVLKAVHAVAGGDLGVVARVVRPGSVGLGDAVRLGDEADVPRA